MHMYGGGGDFPNQKKSLINVIVKNRELHPSVTIRHFEATSILDNTIGRAITILFLRHGEFF